MRKPSKRKMYQKRRKKEKTEQRKKVSLPTATGSTATKSTIYQNKSSSYHNCKQYQQKGNKKKKFNSNNLRNTPASPITSYSESLQLWWQTYCSAIEFHTKQQRSCQDENNDMLLLEKYANEYETSSEEEEDNEGVENVSSESESMDEEYLRFLEITHKHREQLRLKREQENI
ncbi:hypothetical protein DOY81_011983 [Sarcophaga bullata]|nr:hypothetical protein DOY81_011983 [Sarcophaga bullata]